MLLLKKLTHRLSPNRNQLQYDQSILETSLREQRKHTKFTNLTLQKQHHSLNNLRLDHIKTFSTLKHPEKFTSLSVILFRNI